MRRLGLWVLVGALVGGCEGSDVEPESIGSDGGQDDGDPGGTSGATAPGGDESGGGDGGGDGTAPPPDVDPADLDAVEDACEADCEAQFATECAPGNQNVLTCKLSCASVTVQLGNFCLDEYTSSVQCRADGGYDCLNGYPYPRSTCALENATFQECMADLGCKRYCAEADAAGCAGGSFAGCLDACVAEKAAAPGYCGVYYDSLRMCEAQLGIECVDGDPTTTGDCGHAVSNVGDCLADESDDICLGYCFVSEEIGCGSNCAADCAAKVADPTCGQAFESLADCELRHGDYVCTDGALVGIDICDYEEMNYQACLAGG